MKKILKAFVTLLSLIMFYIIFGLTSKYSYVHTEYHLGESHTKTEDRKELVKLYSNLDSDIFLQVKSQMGSGKNKSPDFEVIIVFDSLSQEVVVESMNIKVYDHLKQDTFRLNSVGVSLKSGIKNVDYFSLLPESSRILKIDSSYLYKWTYEASVENMGFLIIETDMNLRVNEDLFLVQEEDKFTQEITVIHENPLRFIINP